MNNSQVEINKVNMTKLSGFYITAKIKIARIIVNLVRRKVNNVNLTYEKQFTELSSNLKSNPNLLELKINPLLLSDLTCSLISVTNALKSTKSFREGTRLCILTERRFSNIIQCVCIQNEVLLIDENSNNSILDEII